MHQMKNRLLAMAAIVPALLGAVLTPDAVQATLAPNVVYGWGANHAGQIGDGTTVDRHIPVAVSGLTGVNSIAAGGYHSLAVLNDRTVWAWGSNTFGAVGDGTGGSFGNDHTVPVSVLTDVTSIAAGSYHSLALRSGGTARAWGYNYHGQLGDITTIDRTLPVAVSGLSNVSSIAGGWGYSLAVLNDGTVRAWGRNSGGQLGNGTTTDRISPGVVPGLSNVSSVAAGGWHHSLALLSDGTVRAWGGNGYGELGDGTTTGHLSPVSVSGLTDVNAIAAGAYHSLALLSDGTVRAWGWNGMGQLGDGTGGHQNSHNNSPVTVPGLSNIVDIAAVGRSSFALSADGRLWAWGSNSHGQLGLGDTTNRLTPTEVLSPLAGYRFSDIAGGSEGFHVLAILEPIPSPASATLLSLGVITAARRRRSR